MRGYTSGTGKQPITRLYRLAPHDAGMDSFRSRSASRGLTRARYLAVAFGRELRIARVNVGLTQGEMAKLAGVSQQQASLVERGIGDTSLVIRARLAAACGHELGWRLYPMATVRLRDSGQLALAQVILAAAHPSWQARLEVPISSGDPRAADLLLIGPTEIIHIEIERALVDFQSQLRSAQIKRDALVAREEKPIRLVIAVPNRQATAVRLAPFAQLIRQTMPVTSRGIWRAIRSGQPLEGDGILFVRAPPAP
jgi:transcriptional regulator with XRE-family HTH domain